MPDPRTIAQDFSTELQEAFEDGLRSVVLFGSVARGEPIPGVSDVNLLVMVDAIDPPRMARAAPVIQDWVRRGNAPPHLFSQGEWRGMRDTFAIEIADMQDAREVLWGEDPIEPRALTRSDLRLHAEREIRETIQHLRLRMFLSADNLRGLGALLLAGLPSFSAYMRTALRLTGVEPPRRTEEVIERTASILEVDAGPLLACQEARREIHPPEVQLVGSTVEGYLDFVNHLMRYIDTLPATSAETLSGATETAP